MSGYWQALSRETHGLVPAGPRPRSRFEDPFADPGIADPFALEEQEVEIEAAPAFTHEAAMPPLAEPRAQSRPATLPEAASQGVPGAPFAQPQPPALFTPPPSPHPAPPQPPHAESAGPAREAVVAPLAAPAAPAPQPADRAAPAAAPILQGDYDHRPLAPAADDPVATALPPLAPEPAAPRQSEIAQAAAPIPVVAQPPVIERAPAQPEPAPHRADIEPREPMLRIEIGEIMIRIASDAGNLPAPVPRGAERGSRVPDLGDWLTGSGGGRA